MNAYIAVATSLPLPPADPIGYPLAPTVLQVLSVFTLGLHFLAVNFTLGSLVALLWLHRRDVPGGDTVRTYLRTALPLGVSYLVTLGIPPLLFVQVLYGQLFYSSSVLMGAFWILVVPTLIGAYALLYYHKLSTGADRPSHLGVLALSLLGLLFVGFLYVNNITLSLHPESWMAKYAAAPAGTSLHLEDPTFWPRLALFLSPAFTVGGLALVLAATVMGSRAAAAADTARGLGWKLHLVGRVASAAAAAGVVATLPAGPWQAVTAAPHWLIGGLVAAAAVTGLTIAAARTSSRLLAVVAAVGLAAEAWCFVAVREVVRTAYLDGVFSTQAVPVHPQWGMFTLFAVSAAVGLAFLVFLTVIVARRAAAARQ